MIFLSHTGADTPSLLRLLPLLGTRDLPYWSDQSLSPGDSFPGAMNSALEHASHFAVLWSRNAAQSPHVWNELDAFYALKPNPGRMLFLRLDGTSVPALYAARLYLDVSGDEVATADRLRDWFAGSTTAVFESPSWSRPDSAETAFVLLVAPGPAVRTKHISRELVQQYVDQVGTRTEVTYLLDEVARLREAAEPGVTRSQQLSAGELPRIGDVSPRDFWIEAFAVAARKGTRTLAALLLAQDDQAFSDEARRDRRLLLSRLRSRDAGLFT